jgi:medium-chain acyl-[acyl-carrier-protein] hydrolase
MTMKSSIVAKQASPWVACNNPPPGGLLRLFCFPYAGGSASIFRAWNKRLSSVAQVCPVQLPGRGERINEVAFTGLVPLIDALVSALAPNLQEPFAFFGHSMGALIAFELARKLRSEHGPLPIHIIVSGRRAPQIPQDSLTYNLGETEFDDELLRLGGIGKEVVEDPEIMQLVKPMIRADFQVCQEYKYCYQLPLPCPLTVLGGSDDPDVRMEHLTPWREQTSGEFAISTFPGEHFFIQSASDAVLRVVERDLSRYRRAGPNVLSRG